ncbi:MAG: hypothetical protein ABFD08_06735 [Syntrophomonas sp.]
MGGIKCTAIVNAACTSAKKSLRKTKFMRILFEGIKNVVVSNAEISDLSWLIRQNRMVVLKPYFQMRNDEVAFRSVHEVVKNYLQVCGTLWLRRTKMERLGVPRCAVLLRYPLALLNIPSAYEEYLNAVGAKTRNRIRKAEKLGYEFREFEWDNHLEEIFDINNSKELRSAGPMQGWYRDQVKPRHHSEIEKRYRKYYGLFKDDRLWAYCHLVLCGDFGFTKHFLGHANHLKNGIMNYLLSGMVHEYLDHSHVQWLNYGIFPTWSREGTVDFRKHTGFEGYAAFLDLEEDQELLKYSKRVRAIGLTNF